jgi:hypothetical protein
MNEHLFLQQMMSFQRVALESILLYFLDPGVGALG